MPPPTRGTRLISMLDQEYQGIVAGDSDNDDARPKLLALCGAKSNNSVTQLQLENLHITSDKYDIHYLHGYIEEMEADSNLDGLFRGPFYSWIDDSSVWAMNESIVNSVRLVLKAVQMHGPFDGIYGFSNGKHIYPHHHLESILYYFHMSLIRVSHAYIFRICYY